MHKLSVVTQQKGVVGGLAKLFKFLSGTGVPAVSFGVGAGLGGTMAAHTSRILDHNFAWSVVTNRHKDEMSGWEEEADKIRRQIVRVAPEISREPEMLWTMIKNVKESGGLSYPIARNLLNTETSYNVPTIAIPEFPRESDRGHGQHQHRVQPTAMSKESAINWQNVRGMASDAGKGALAGAGIGMLGYTIAHLLSGSKMAIGGSMGWSNFFNKYKSQVAGWESQAKEYYDALYKTMPMIAKDPDLAWSFVGHMRSQGGMDLTTLSDLAQSRNSHSRRVESNVRGLTELMSASSTIGGLG